MTNYMNSTSSEPHKQLTTSQSHQPPLRNIRAFSSPFSNFFPENDRAGRPLHLTRMNEDISSIHQDLGMIVQPSPIFSMMRRRADPRSPEERRKELLEILEDVEDLLRDSAFPDDRITTTEDGDDDDSYNADTTWPPL